MYQLIIIVIYTYIYIYIYIYIHIYIIVLFYIYFIYIYFRAPLLHLILNLLEMEYSIISITVIQRKTYLYHPIPSDKSTYSKFLTENISQTYKKTKLKLLQITMEFQKELIVLQN